MALIEKVLGRGGVHEDPVLREVQAGGRRFERVVFTRNVRVMVSVGGNGRVLRLHERFRDAPAEVLRAIGAMYAKGRRRDPAESRSVVREYIRVCAEAGQTGPMAPPAPRRSRPAAPGDELHVERLRREFDHVNLAHFGGSLPVVPISLSGRMKRRNGHFSPVPLEIVISRRLCEMAAPHESEMTLRHEMIHLWQHVEGRRPGHGRDFREVAARIGVHPRATRRVRWGKTAGRAET